MEKKIKLPLKLPVNERKKLSLIIESTTPVNCKKHEEQEQEQDKSSYKYPCEQTSNEILNKIENNFDQFRLSNDTYLSFSEEKNDSTNDTSSDSNSYYVLNELLSSEMLNSNSDVSNPTLNEHINDDDIDNDDDIEDTYYLPFGLISKKEKDENDKEENDTILNYVKVNVHKDEPILNKEIEQEPMVSTTNYVPILMNSNNKPKLPKKMNRKEFQNSFRALKGTTRPIETGNLISNAQNTHYKDEDIYCPPSTQQMFTYETFRREIYRKNKICADCQTNESSNISCRYFITLCDQCTNIHNKLPHKASKFYLIDFKTIYKELTNELNKQKYFHINSFLCILNETGNEKMNNLFEYDEQLANRLRSVAKNMDEFIKEKYINKKFINNLELDYSQNYLQTLNKTLYIEGLCLPIIIYNLYIGANINYSVLNKSVFDIACQSGHETNQINYLKLNDALSFENINESALLDYEFEGELIQVYDVNTSSKISILKKNFNLNKKKLIINQILKSSNSNRLEIDYQAIIRIQPNFKNNLIELNWCNKKNNSIVSSYFQYSSLNEKELWLKEFFIKMLASLDNNVQLFKSNSKLNVLQFFDLLSSCQINMMGYLNLDTLELDDENGQLVLAVLIETSELQSHNYFHRKLILIKIIETNITIETIDLRKIRIKLKENNFIRIDFENRYFILRSHGYFNNLKTWHDAILFQTQMNFISLNDQYLTKENVPILIEKLCSFVEFNYIQNKLYYSNLKLMKNNYKSNSLMNKLLKEKGYELNLHGDTLNALNLFKSFFSTYFISKYSILYVKHLPKLFDAATSEHALKNYLDYHSNKHDFTNSKISFSALKNNEYTTHIDDEISINIEKLKSFLYKQSQTNATFYYTLRRISIHLHLISIFKDKNKMNEEYLAELFAPLIFGTSQTQLIIPLRESIERLQFKETFDFNSKYYMFECMLNFYFNKILKCLIEKCTLLFNLKETYLQTQINIIQRSFELNKINRFSIVVPSAMQQPVEEKKIKYLITIYVESKKDEKSFQFSIDSETTCQDILQLQDFHTNYSLFEIFDFEQHKLIAEKFYSKIIKNDSILMQRLLPLDFKLFNILSKWNKFYLCLKKTEQDNPIIMLQEPSNLQFDEKCECILYCRHCGYFNKSISNNSDNNTECNHHSHKKWKNIYLTIQNETIKIFKQRQEDSNVKSNKLFYEFQIQDLICYHGLYYSNSELDLVIMNKKYLETFILEEECLTLYDKKLNNVICVHLKSKQLALKLYQIFFENAYHEHFKIQHFINSNHKSRLCKININDPTNNATNLITRMFEKIIRK